MAVRTEAIAVSLPGLRAMRWWTDELYRGVKELYAIGRVVSGRSEWWTNGHVRASGPGSLQIKQPGDVHRTVSRDGPILVQVVTFPARVVEAITGKARVNGHFAVDDDGGAAFQRLHDAVATGADRLALEIAVAETMATLASIAARAGTNSEGPSRPVRRAMELLRQRLADNLTLDDLADYAGLDKFHLCRAFRAQIGIPPHAYLTQLRILRAKELLAAGVKPRDIAPHVGLYDQSQLNRHFRRIVGTTPGHYARSI